MNDFGDIGGTGTGVGAAAAIWALVKVLKKDRVAEALEAVTKELHELRTQVAVLLDREDLREKRLADMEDRLRKLENGRRSGSFPAYVPATTPPEPGR